MRMSLWSFFFFFFMIILYIIILFIIIIIIIYCFSFSMKKITLFSYVFVAVDFTWPRVSKIWFQLNFVISETWFQLYKVVGCTWSRGFENIDSDKGVVSSETWFQLVWKYMILAKVKKKTWFLYCVWFDFT